MVCVKGATITESLHKDRLLHPMMRDSLDEPFRRVSWDEALDRIVNRIQTLRATVGPDTLCMYGSGQFNTEDYYVAQKLMKGFWVQITSMQTRVSACLRRFLRIFKALGLMVPPAAMKTWI